MGRVLPGLALWAHLQRQARHPMAPHFRRQLKRGRWLNPLSASLLWALALAGFGATVAGGLGGAMVWSLPLWLMLFSAGYCALWIAGVVVLLAQGAGVWEEFAVIPPGRAYVYLIICKVVVNEGEALAWLSLLRRAFLLLAGCSLVMALVLAGTQVGAADPLAGAGLLVESLLIALLFPVEHRQSVLMACLLAILVGVRARDIDRASAAIAVFALAQVLSYGLSLAVVIVLDRPSLGATLAAFMLLRELAIGALWHAVLRGANATGFALGSRLAGKGGAACV